MSSASWMMRAVERVAVVVNAISARMLFNPCTPFSSRVPEPTQTETDTVWSPATSRDATFTPLLSVVTSVDGTTVLTPVVEIAGRPPISSKRDDCDAKLRDRIGRRRASRESIALVKRFF